MVVGVSRVLLAWCARPFGWGETLNTDGFCHSVCKYITFQGYLLGMLFRNLCRGYPIEVVLPVGSSEHPTFDQSNFHAIYLTIYLNVSNG